mgnify:CR=1 FL=1
MAQKTAANWIGDVISALVVLALFADAGVQLFAPHLLKEPMDATGFPMSLAVPLGVVMMVCGVLYAIPRTVYLGAILTTAFLGGAICPPQFTHWTGKQSKWALSTLKKQLGKEAVPPSQSASSTHSSAGVWQK